MLLPCIALQVRMLLEWPRQRANVQLDGAKDALLSAANNGHSGVVVLLLTTRVWGTSDGLPPRDILAELDEVTREDIDLTQQIDEVVKSRSVGRLPGIMLYGRQQQRWRKQNKW